MQNLNLWTKDSKNIPIKSNTSGEKYPWNQNHKESCIVPPREPKNPKYHCDLIQ